MAQFMYTQTRQPTYNGVDMLVHVLGADATVPLEQLPSWVDVGRQVEDVDLASRLRISDCLGERRSWW